MRRRIGSKVRKSEHAKSLNHGIRCHRVLELIIAFWIIITFEMDGTLAERTYQREATKRICAGTAVHVGHNIRLKSGLIGVEMPGHKLMRMRMFGELEVRL